MTTVKVAQAIRNAIEAELASARFYALLADSTDEPESRAFLARLSAQELRHASEIEQAGTELVGSLPDYADSDVAVVETLPAWRFVDDMTLGQALEVALAAEHSAALFYEALANQLAEPVRSLFHEMASTELDHANDLEAERARVHPRRR